MTHDMELISTCSYAPVGAVLLSDKVADGIRDKNGFWKVSKQMREDSSRLTLHLTWLRSPLVTTAWSHLPSTSRWLCRRTRSSEGNSL